jgi:hypothetical protein
MVYFESILRTMGKQKDSKLNRLLGDLGDADLASARWLRANGYSTSLVARYLRSGWLQSPARGVYALPRAKLQWDGVLRSLQQREGLRLHAGGRFALSWHGHEHYLRLGEAATVTVYGSDRLPGWATRLPLNQGLQACGRGPFDPTSFAFSDATDDATLFAEGLEREADSSSIGEVVMASPERAMLELCDDRPGAALAYEADAVMQGMLGLRPELVERLLQQCRSVKAKRLFLALAERHRHAWLARVDLAGVDLGSGKRVLAPGGRLDSKYLITLPADLGEQLG